MLGSEYLKINNETYTPSTFSYSLQAQEQVFKSAAGTELVNIVRLDKHVFSVGWEGIDSTLLDALEGLCQLPVVSVEYRSQTYTCRVRGIAPDMLNKSYKYKRSDGLWNASFTMTEL